MGKSRMTPAQLQQARAAAEYGNYVDRLTRAALGDGVTRVDQRKADATLTQAVGKRQARALKNQAIKKARNSLF